MTFSASRGSKWGANAAMSSEGDKRRASAMEDEDGPLNRIRTGVARERLLALDQIPAPIADFLRKLHTSLCDKKEFLLENVYEIEFPKLSQQFYARSRWLDPSIVERFYTDMGGSVTAEHKDVLLLLYKELFYRHLHTLNPETGVKVMIDEREGSWTNYQNLFAYFCSNEMTTSRSASTSCLTLPLVWSFEMLDEFIYQWSQFKFWHNKMSRNRSDNLETEEGRVKFQEMKALAGSRIWDSCRVFELLQELVFRSRVNEHFENMRQKTAAGSTIRAAGLSVESSLGLQIGYFAVIQLLRVHCLMGDYRMALFHLQHFAFGGDALFYRVANCHLSLFYYMGYCYMMLRRYTDCVRVFSSVLTFLTTKKDDYLNGTQEGHLRKMRDRMYQLLLMCVCLHPQKVEESINAYLQEHLLDRQIRLLRDDEEEFQSVFREASPKFVHPAYPPFASMASYDPLELSSTQVAVFMQEVRHQKWVPTIRSYARLYSAMSIKKLASLMEKDEQEVRNFLLCVKHKSRQLVWTTGPPLSGQPTATDEGVEFYLDKDMIHVRSHSESKSYESVFIRDIPKFTEMAKAQERTCTSLMIIK